MGKKKKRFTSKIESFSRLFCLFSLNTLTWRHFYDYFIFGFLKQNIIVSARLEKDTGRKDGFNLN